MRIVTALLVMTTMGVPMLTSQTPTQGERDRAMSYLHATRKQFLDAALPLSEAQWKYKPAGGGWSVADIAEHVTATEGAILGNIEKSLQRPPTPERKSETAGKDEIVMNAVPNRSRKVQSPDELKPTGRWPTRQSLVTGFKSQRDRAIEFIEKTQADLRSHMAPHPVLKMLDCYQWTLFLAAHTDRHLQQMREVMADPGFPKP
jgi:hypothetical protein